MEVFTLKLWFAAFLGLVQGVTEFLPVSSSGHLSILQNMFGLENVEQSHLLFDVMLHLGTLISVFIAYRKDIADILRAIFATLTGKHKGGKSAEQKNRASMRLFIMVIIATLPLFVAVFLNDYAEKLYNNTLFIGIALLVTGILLYVSDRAARGKKNEKSATMGNALITGIAQAIAIVPGLSRSGTTISVGIFQGFDREFAVKFSFLMSIPAILGANILTFIKAIKAGVDFSLMPTYLVGVLVAAVSGYFAISLVRYITKKDKFGGFAYYCWAVGLITIVLTVIV